MIHTKELDAQTLKVLQDLLDRDSGELTTDEIAILAARQYYLSEEEKIDLGIIKLKKKRKFLR